MAEKDLQAAYAYTYQDRPTAARTVMQRIVEAIDHLVMFTSMGPRGSGTEYQRISGKPHAFNSHLSS
jgi:plasmid stabilization system protein ParE